MLLVGKQAEGLGNLSKEDQIPQLLPPDTAQPLPVGQVLTGPGWSAVNMLGCGTWDSSSGATPGNGAPCLWGHCPVYRGLR